MKPDDDALAEFRRLRQEHRRRCDAKLRHVRFISEDDWLARGLAGDINGMTRTDEDILIAVRGTPLPGLGSYWTGLMVLAPGRAQGQAWINEITAAIPTDAVARVFDGAASIPQPLVANMLELIQEGGFESFRTVPDRCYDGAPTRITLYSRKVGQLVEASANAADDGKEPTLVLAKIAWQVKAGIRLLAVSPPGRSNEPGVAPS